MEEFYGRIEQRWNHVGCVEWKSEGRIIYGPTAGTIYKLRVPARLRRGRRRRPDVSNQRKKPWRYRWPDDFRDEVLARLLELNEQRYKEESGVAAEPKSKKKSTKKKAAKKI